MKKNWKFCPSKLDFTNNRIPSPAEFRKRSQSRLTNALQEIRKGFKHNLKMRKTIKHIKDQTRAQMYFFKIKYFVLYVNIGEKQPSRSLKCG